MLRVLITVVFVVAVAVAGVYERETCDFVHDCGYPCEKHWVTTDDGYILQMVRIPNEEAERVLYWQHGILDSSDSAVMNTEDESLAFYFAGLGYDVWMGNNRGNKYSRNHTTLNPDKNQFWEFSFDEYAQYDVPAQLNFILESTGKSQVYYAGHSQGTTQAFANFASPSYSVASKIKAAALLAPIARIYHSSSLPFQLMTELRVDKLAEIFDRGEFLADSNFMHKFLGSLCDIDERLCETALYWFVGFDSKYLNDSRLDVYTDQFPTGTSVYGIEHYCQQFRHNKFRKYDYGALKNLAKYGSLKPPSYDVSSIEAPPLGLFHGTSDDLADLKDVSWLVSQLPKVDLIQRLDDFDHLTFVIGDQNSEILYPAMADFFANY